MNLGCLGCCCPPIGNYMLAEKLGTDDVIKYIGFLDFLGGAGLCSFIQQFILRGKIRERDGIQGDEIGDFVSSFCCLECSICQTINHVGLE